MTIESSATCRRPEPSRRSANAQRPSAASSWAPTGAKPFACVRR